MSRIPLPGGGEFEPGPPRPKQLDVILAPSGVRLVGPLSLVQPLEHPAEEGHPVDPVFAPVQQLSQILILILENHGIEVLAVLQ